MEFWTVLSHKIVEDLRFVLYILVLFLVGCSQKTVTKYATPLSIQLKDTFLCSDKVQLSTPIVEVDSIFFNERTTVAMEFGQAGSELLYQLNDKDIKVYESPLIIDETCLIKVIATHPKFIESDTTYRSIIKVNKLLHSADAQLTPDPNPKYPGEGLHSLLDHKKGTLDFSKNKRWCGFDEEEISLQFQFDPPVDLSALYLSLLTDEASWIFSPRRIKVLLNGTQWYDKICKATQQGEVARLQCAAISWKEMQVNSMKVIIENHTEIPDWHKGAGMKPWLFIDEIIAE